MIGLIGQKVGMTQVFNEYGELIPVTVLRVEPNYVVDQRTEEKNGYDAVVIGAVDAKPSRVSKPRAGQFAKSGVTPKRYVIELRDFDKECALGDAIGVEVFADAGYVDVVGRTKGKGYQGVMKRHGFGGGRKTHGSKFHRGNGSTGQAAWPSRVLPGTKMPGRMGNAQRTVQNLRVVKVDPEKQMMLVGGAVPGTPDGYVVIRTAKKKG